MLEMWDFWDVGCEMFAGMLIYKMPFVKQKFYLNMRKTQIQKLEINHSLI